MRGLLLLALCFATVLGTGCVHTVKSNYFATQVDYPADWYKSDADEDLAPFDWKAFNDPQLDRWLCQVMASNNDLAIAGLRVYRARLDAERIGVAGDPELKGALGAGSKTQLNNGSDWTKGSTASLSTSYELDLWGKISRQRNAAEWGIHATQEDLRSARLTLLSEASNNYWRIGFVNQQIAVLKQSIDYAKETLRLARARYRAGKASPLDVEDAQQNLLTQENRLTGLHRDRLQTLNQQAVLQGAAPGSPVVEPATLPKGPMPQVMANIPVSVLRHRPDIRAKEWRVREALATVDIKRTEYYPAFSLTGSLGTSSSSLLTFLHNPAVSIGTTLTLPFLEWQQRSVDVKIARNDYEQRVVEFKQLLYKAMSSIANELSLRNQLLAQEVRLRKGLESARNSERLNEARYRQGAARISFWLDAQELRRQTELLLDENRFNQFKNLASIYLEFGGQHE